MPVMNHGYELPPRPLDIAMLVHCQAVPVGHIRRSVAGHRIRIRSINRGHPIRFGPGKEWIEAYRSRLGRVG